MVKSSGYVLKKSTMEWANQRFGLPATGVEQDWDIEMADGGRLEEFLRGFEEEELEDENRLALMALVLASADAFLHLEPSSFSLWPNLKQELTEHQDLYQCLLDYWMESNGDNGFQIGKLLRKNLEK